MAHESPRPSNWFYSRLHPAAGNMAPLPVLTFSDTFQGCLCFSTQSCSRLTNVDAQSTALRILPLPQIMPLYSTHMFISYSFAKLPIMLQDWFKSSFSVNPGLISWTVSHSCFPPQTHLRWSGTLWGQDSCLKGNEVLSTQYNGKFNLLLHEATLQGNAQVFINFDELLTNACAGGTNILHNV